MTARTALLAGGTGAVGFALLHLLLQDDAYESVLLTTRKSWPKGLNEHDKVKLIHLPNSDGAANDGCDLHLPKVTHFFSALGTTQKASGKAGLRYVDHTLVIRLARAAKEAGCQYASVVSALGAHARSPFFYNRVKGRMEASLRALQYDHTRIWQPSFILAKRTPPRRLESFFGPLFKSPRLGDLMALSAYDVALAMWQEAQESFDNTAPPTFVRYRATDIHTFCNA